ncbi:enoyl-CoA hydratase/isomerase family protein [Algoriphagus sp. Y33]|uniref:enoyl-CoA hydratase/isomerase family protein n=1 Tax=Algoriphagus sp. Y33 TaxID=2772483 RepID=UPI0017858576|nr:enoyl-CoA hydratase-related protein [Algoriphagus sp. Y33]
MSAVLTEVVDRIGIITLNRPEKRNALNPEMIAGLHSAFEDMNSDGKVKVIVLRSTGKTFCAGADLAYLQQLQGFSQEENLKDSLRLMSLFNLVYCLPKVVIAEIHGHALAGGCGLATVCDFAFSVPDALFGYTEVRIGFVPALVSVFLQEQIGAAKTQELLLSGEFISASKASELGLITGVEASEFLRRSVEEFALKLVSQNSAFSMGKTKTLLRQLNEIERIKSLQLAAEVNSEARAHEDCKKGIAAFLNKTSPDW